MAEITTADLLSMQNTIIGTVRYEVGLAREEFKAQIGELKTGQKDQDERADRHARELARLDERTKVAKTLFGSLTPKQKAALWSTALALGGVILDYARQLVVALLALRGVHP